MKTSIRSIFILLLLAISCNKDDAKNPEENNDDIISENPDSDIEFSEGAISYNLVDLKWSTITGPNNETVVYDIYLGDEKIKDSNEDTDYTLTQLDADTEYSGRIVPKTLNTNKSSISNKVSSTKKAEELTPIKFALKTKRFPNPNSPTPEFTNSDVNNITNNEATLTWTTATISDNSDISYNIYLEGDLIANTLTSNSYTFENLKPKTLYKGVILAISTNLKSTAIDFEFTTLADIIEILLTDFEFYRGASTSYPASDWLQLIPLFSPLDANAVDLIWTSSDENIATVDNSGYVNTRNIGTTIITATFSDDATISKSIELNVTQRLAFDEKFISIQPKRSSLLIGESKKFQINKFNIENGSSDDSFIFSSSDTNIATIDNDGNVTGITEGTVAITVTSTVDSNITESAMLRVVSTPISVTSLTIWGELDRTVYVEPNRGTGIGIGAEPEDATDKTLIYTSTNTNIITVSATGSIRAIAPGNASIITTSASNNEISKTVNYTVLEDPVSFDENTGIYKANASSKATMEVFGRIEVPNSEANDVFLEISYSVKDTNGNELLDIQNQTSTFSIYEDPNTGMSIIDTSGYTINFTIPSDGEVTIDVSVNIQTSTNTIISGFDLIISNNEGTTKQNPIPSDKIFIQ